MMNSILIISLVIGLIEAQKDQPNIVLILTDDLDSELNGLLPLSKTRSLIGDEGTTFINSFVSTPICCPSRASILTGLYQHNTGVLNNSIAGNCASKAWQKGPERKTVATYLKQANYVTFYAGKYLNQYGNPQVGGLRHVPPGWDFWAGLKGNSRYYNYKLSINGKTENHGQVYDNDYLTDVISRKATSFLKLYDQNELANPFFMVLSTPSPHAPFTPAPQYQNSFKNLKAPRNEAFNFVEDSRHAKHWFINTKPRPLPEDLVAKVDEAFRNRYRTLLSVDDMVENLIENLEKLELLNDTYILFTSDHGYHLGQFGLPLDKRQPYETDLRVPLLIRGPGIKRKSKSTDVIVNIDLAPTILEMAGIQMADRMDGQSFLAKIKNNNIITRSDFEERCFLVSYHGEGNAGNDEACKNVDNLSECSSAFDCKCQDSRNNTYNCVRSLSTDAKGNIFCQFEDDVKFIEYYNLKEDAYQLRNLAYTLTSAQRKNYERRIRLLQKCKGKHQCSNFICNENNSFNTV